MYIDDGLSLATIAKKLGIRCHQTVASMLRKAGVPIRSSKDVAKGRLAYWESRRMCFADINRQYWRGVINSAKIRSINFNITIEEAWELFLSQKQMCALTGLKIELVRTGYERSRLKLSQTASLDRIDSNGDYSRLNCQWIHKDLQTMKMSMDEGTFRYWCGLIAKQMQPKDWQDDSYLVAI